ncbi:PREDICTED: sterol O-acyltransferase 1 [Dipodomys ordii]|uniref:O-acyltransferase n=1 Tax=Dipodomys ordii TaxID=10020 RepID=A0A1S3F561_DIPOR|nr:PREDICTED: sterol O-acyltransferase 1 [Dipodomys ordii]
MVGEEKMALRNRVTKSSEIPEKDEDQRNLTKESLETHRNGQLDIKQLIAKKRQLAAEAEELKPLFLKEVGSHFDDFVTNLIEKSASLDNGGCALTTFSILDEMKNNHRAKDLRAPPEQGKIFIARRSLLDELFEVDHIRTIYHMFIALLLIFILSTSVVDYIDEGRLVPEFNLMSYAFGKFSTVIWTWCLMFLSTLSIPYFLFQHWAKGYSKSSHRFISTFIHGLFFIVFQLGILGFGPTYITLTYSLPPASRFIVILEQIRMVMKAHSFVRENVPRVLNAAKEKSSTVPIPTVNQYLYFLFAPTLIYRDSYPRTPTVRWRYVVMQFTQVFGCLFYVYYIFERLCAPLFRNIKQEPFSARVLVLCVFNSILPGVLILFLTFFAFLHCWLNAFAEMLRFGDRMFYKFFTKRFKSAAMLAVFAMSAVVHEYALAVCLSYFYPVLFVLFMSFGMAFNFIVNDGRKRPIWNIMMWTSLFLGHGVVLCFYSQEWYARQHCPLKNPTFLDYIRPRSWTCRYVF